MGSAKQLPVLPDLEFLRVANSDRNYRLFYQECNYLQVLEGGIDPTASVPAHARRRSPPRW